MEVALSDDQVSALDECMEEFNAGDRKARTALVQEIFDDFAKTWPRDTRKIGEVGMKDVCAPFATLGCSDMLLAYSPVPLLQKTTGNERICFKPPNSDG